MNEALHRVFRHEYGRLVSHLTRVLGPAQVDLAEDALQEALCRASVLWPMKGVPDRPSAWLLAVARNHALDSLRRRATFRRKEAELIDLTEALSATSAVDPGVLGAVVQDDQLRMMFACCDPAIPADAQVAVLLKVLCGFSAAEIAQAFLSSVAAVEKRIARGKHALAASGALAEIGPAEVEARRPGVCQALYLLFNEGYMSGRSDGIRDEVCFEAMRLTAMLGERPATDHPMVRALLALMCFHSARLPARRDDQGHLVLLLDQDRATWDRDLIAQGFAHLQASQPEQHLSPFHVEALLSAQHILAPRPEDTDWAALEALYRKLLEMKPSPVVRLNLAVVIGKGHGPEAGLQALDAIRDLESYAYLHAARGELLAELGRVDEARAAWTRAIALCANPVEAACLTRRRDRLRRRPG